MSYINKEFSPEIHHMSVDEIYKCFNDNAIKNEYCDLLSLWYKTIREYPENISIEDGNKQITYAQLDVYSDTVASHIIKEQWNHSGYVLVEAKRNWKTIGIILGILKSGAAYVPIYESLPEYKLNLIKEETKCNLVLTSEDKFTDYSSNSSEYKVLGEQCAYVLFTSGSTGVPKGVMVPHISVAETVQSVNRLLGLNEYDTVLGISELTFDLSVFDLFGTFAAGAKLIIVQDNKNLALLNELIIKHKISIINTVPYVVKLILEFAVAINVNMNEYAHLRTLILSGDVVPSSTVDLILENLKLTNLYIMGGPTEITVWSNYYLYKEGKQVLDYIPYGSPLSNKSMYVVADNKPVVEEEGEIYSGKMGLAIGYHGNEKLTKQQFINFEKLGRVYKTGDKGILTKDGTIQILGRVDNQVKVNGFRVELEEIEKHLNDFEEINQSISCLFADKNSSKLMAGVKLNIDISEEEIKAKLAEKVPVYCVPHNIFILEKIPLSVNNKLDRKKFLEHVTNRI